MGRLADYGYYELDLLARYFPQANMGLLDFIAYNPWKDSSPAKFIFCLEHGGCEDSLTKEVEDRIRHETNIAIYGQEQVDYAVKALRWAVKNARVGFTAHLLN